MQMPNCLFKVFLVLVFLATITVSSVTFAFSIVIKNETGVDLRIDSLDNNCGEFHFHQKTGLLMQHNYTANVIGGFAKAANVVAKHSENGGLVYPSSRIVTPRNKDGIALRRPILIDISVHTYRLTDNEKEHSAGP